MARTRAVILAGIVLMAATGLAGFTWALAGPAAVASVTATSTATPKTTAPPPASPMTGPLPRVSVPQSGTAVGGTSGGHSPTATSGPSYWLFGLIGAVADSILALLTVALVFMYLLLRRTPTYLHVRRSSRSGRSGRSSRTGRRESGAGQPDGSNARQITAEPTAKGSAAAKPRTKLLADTFDWFVPPRRLPGSDHRPTTPPTCGAESSQ